MKFKILLFVTVLGFASHTTYATSLGVGDLAITSANADGDDNFSFVLLTNISGTTTVYFTERAWNDDASNGGVNPNWLTSTDGTITWTFSGTLPAGTEIQIIDPSEANTVGSVSQGTITETDAFSVSSLSDAIIAYTGTGTPNDGSEVTNFIWATAWNNDFLSSNTSSQRTSIPTGLTNGTNAVDISSSGDNIQYDCSETTPVATLRAGLANDSKYNIDDNTTYLAPGCAYLTALTTTWNGATWSNGTPTINTDVIINSNTSPGSFSCNDLTISNGFSLSTDANTITIGGDFTNNGNGFSGTGTLSFDNDGNTLSLSGNAMTYEGIISVEGTTTLATGGLLTLSASSASSYGQLTGIGTISGNVSIESYLSPGSGGRYYHLGSPFLNAILSDFNETGATMVSANTQQGTAWEWNAANAEWDPAGGGNIANTAVRGTGYALYVGTNGIYGPFLRNGNGTITLIGTIDNSTTVGVALGYNDGQTSSQSFASGTAIEDTEGWNLVANPYAAVYDWDTQLTPGGMATAIYRFNGTNYSSYTQGVGTASRYIAPFQAFFVQMTGNIAATLTFDRDNRQPNQSASLNKTANYTVDGVYLHIEGMNGTVYDDVFAGFEANSTANYDTDWDARKLLNADHVPNLYVTLGSTPYSICRVPYMNSQSFPLHLDYTVDGDEMVISADIAQLKSFALVELEDLKTGIRHDLTGSDYTFKYDASFGSDRFILHFGKGTVGLEKENPLLDVFAYRYDSGFKIDLGSLQNANVKLFSLSGQLLNQQENVNGTITLPIMEQGVFLVRVSAGNSEQTIKVIR